MFSKHELELQDKCHLMYLAVTDTRQQQSHPHHHPPIWSLCYSMMDLKAGAHESLSVKQPLFPGVKYYRLPTIHWRGMSSSLTRSKTLTDCDAFFPSGIPLEQALAVTEQPAMAMFIVPVLNRQHMAWAAVSGAKFVPLCSFRGYL